MGIIIGGDIIMRAGATMRGILTLPGWAEVGRSNCGGLAPHERMVAGEYQ